MNSVIDIVEKLKIAIPVEWDRYTNDDGYYIVYGWILRTDGQRDFLMIAMWETDPPEAVFYTTSSAKYSRKIAEVIYGSADDHNDCRKIDDLFHPLTQD